MDAKPWDRDPLALRKPWSEREYALEEHGGGVGMCFAVMWDNGVVKPHPPLYRAMKIVREALEAAGHKGLYGVFSLLGLRFPWIFPC